MNKNSLLLLSTLFSATALCGMEPLVEIKACLASLANKPTPDAVRPKIWQHVLSVMMMHENELNLVLCEPTTSELDAIIKALPTIIKHNIRKLDISYGWLKSLPQSITQLINLHDFCAQHAGLDKLPDFIGTLSNLEHIDVFQNSFKSLPESIVLLSNLRRLDIDSGVAVPPSLRPDICVIKTH